jgi:hypothetical protein
MKYLKTFEELSPEERAERVAISNFPHKSKEESEKIERRVKISQKEDPDGMYPRDDERYDDKSNSEGWQDGMGKPSWLGEGKLMKASNSKDSDVKIDEFRDKVKDYLKSLECDIKKVGDDFEIHVSKKHVGQVMFRKDLITVKKVGVKFGKEFKYNEFGKIKAEIKSIIK